MNTSNYKPGNRGASYWEAGDAKRKFHPDYRVDSYNADALQHGGLTMDLHEKYTWDEVISA